MKILLIYILIMGAGIVLGYKTGFSSKSRSRDLFQKGCLLVILLELGHQLGANEEVASSMTSMGLTGLLLCLAAMAGSFIVVLALRMALEGRKSARRGEEDVR